MGSSRIQMGPKYNDMSLEEEERTGRGRRWPREDADRDWNGSSRGRGSPGSWQPPAADRGLGWLLPHSLSTHGGLHTRREFISVVVSQQVFGNLLRLP